MQGPVGINEHLFRVEEPLVEEQPKIGLPCCGRLELQLMTYVDKLYAGPHLVIHVANQGLYVWCPIYRIAAGFLTEALVCPLIYG